MQILKGRDDEQEAEGDHHGQEGIHGQEATKRRCELAQKVAVAPRCGAWVGFRVALVFLTTVPVQRQQEGRHRDEDPGRAAERVRSDVNPMGERRPGRVEVEEGIQEEHAGRGEPQGGRASGRERDWDFMIGEEIFRGKEREEGGVDRLQQHG